jgi:lysophospholipase L1-like esterase
MKLVLTVLTGLVLCGATAWAESSGIVIKSGQKIGFLGDSITAQGAGPDGYITLVIAGLKAEDIDATAVPAGVPGNTSGNMRSRLQPNVLSQGVNWMTLSCGVNDVLLQKKGHGVPLDKYKENVTAILDAAKAASVQVILLTPTPVGEDLQGDNNKLLQGYLDFLHDIAKQRGLILADMNGPFRAEITAHPGPEGTPSTYNQGRLLADNVHPNFKGQHLMAEILLLALGVPKDDLPKAEANWPTKPTPRHRAPPASAPASSPSTNQP